MLVTSAPALPLGALMLFALRDGYQCYEVNMSKPVVLVVLEDNELKTEILGGEPTVIVVDLDALLGDGSGAQEKLDELQSLPADTVDQWKLHEIEDKLRDIIDGDPEGFDDDEEFDEDDFDDEDFDDDEMGYDEDDELIEDDDEDDARDDLVAIQQAEAAAEEESFGPVS